MATGIIKTFTDSHEKRVNGLINGVTVNNYCTLYMSVDMTQTYVRGDGKSTLTFNNFKIKYGHRSGLNLGSVTSYVFGDIHVIANGKTYQVFLDSDGDDTAPAYRVQISKSDVYATVQDVDAGAAWTNSIEVEHDPDGNLSVDVVWSGITLEYSWNGLGFAIAGSETVALTKNPLAYSLTVSAGTGATIAVSRKSSASGAGTGALNNGAAIYPGDVLAVQFAANAGYKLTNTKINGAASSGGDISVTGNVDIVAVAAVLAYALSLSVASRSTATVKRTASPLQGAAPGTLGNGQTIYHGDTLSIEYEANAGYKATATLNGNDIASGATHTVLRAVAIVIAVKSMGAISVGNGTAFLRYQPVVGNGTAYINYIPKIG